MLKNLLKLILATTLPVLYLVLKQSVPDFPLAGNQFTDLIVWAVGYLVGGWEAFKIYAKRQLTLKNVNNTRSALTNMEALLVNLLE